MVATYFEHNSAEMNKQGGLSDLLMDGYVRGNLSEKTLRFINDNNISNMIREWVEHHGLGVFSTVTLGKSGYVVSNDPTRKMAVFTNAKDMKDVPSNIRKAIQMIIADIKKHYLFTKGRNTKLVCKLKVQDATVSLMIDGTDNQQRHTDFSRKQIVEQFYNATSTNTDRQHMPLVFFLALENNTKLGYYPRSHQLIINSDAKRFRVMDHKVLEFDNGGFAFIHPLLVHFGFSYTRRLSARITQQLRNTRVHLYIESPGCTRAKDAKGLPMTYPVIFDEHQIQVWSKAESIAHARTQRRNKRELALNQIQVARASRIAKAELQKDNQKAQVHMDGISTKRSLALEDSLSSNATSSSEEQAQDNGRPKRLRVSVAN